METALREHSARVVVHIDALAASAASFLAMAGDEIVMSKGAMMMIHKAWTWTWGNADELKATAALLDKIDGTLVETYADRSSTSADDIRAWMAAETWFTAQEAIDAGLADKLAESEPTAAQARWNLSAYSHAPKPRQSENDPVPQIVPAHASADHRHRQQQRLRALRLAVPIE
jgi:ATP-dependent Clp protease protease subunit